MGESGFHANDGKRLAWNKLSEGLGSETTPTTPVIDAVSWPALSESTRPQSQGTGSPLSEERQNIVVPTRQKLRHNGSDGGHLQQGPIATNSPKDNPQRDPIRNRNGSQRGDGARHNNYGSRREQDRRRQNWNTHRNFNARDTHMPPRVVPRFIRPPPPPLPNSAQFIPPPPLPPFRGPIGFSEIQPPVVYVTAPPPDSLRGVPFIPQIPPHAMYFPASDPQLHTKIVNQIDYYFSVDNLIKDTYLRQSMDDQGWVPIKLIAGFKKVMHLTDNIQLIIDAVRTSSVIELQGNKIRRRNDWRRWILPPSFHLPNVTRSQAYRESSIVELAEKVQSVALQKTTSNDGGQDVQPDASWKRPLFGDLNSPLPLSTSEGSGIQGSDHSISAP